MDSISAMVGRAMPGKSPLKPGRDYLHHRLLNIGVSNNVYVATMPLLHAFLVVVGLVGNHLHTPTPIMFWAFVMLVIGHYFLTPRIISQNWSGHIQAS